MLKVVKGMKKRYQKMEFFKLKNTDLLLVLPNMFLMKF